MMTQNSGRHCTYGRRTTSLGSPTITNCRAIPSGNRERARKGGGHGGHWRKDGSPLALQQHHDEPGRLRVAGVAPHDVNIGGPLVERLPGLERDGGFSFQLHDDLAFEHVDERMGVVPMDYVL